MEPTMRGPNFHRKSPQSSNSCNRRYVMSGVSTQKVLSVILSAAILVSGGGFPIAQALTQSQTSYQGGGGPVGNGFHRSDMTGRVSQVSGVPSMTLPLQMPQSGTFDSVRTWSLLSQQKLMGNKVPSYTFQVQSGAGDFKSLRGTVSPATLSGRAAGKSSYVSSAQGVLSAVEGNRNLATIRSRDGAVTTVQKAGAMRRTYDDGARRGIDYPAMAVIAAGNRAAASGMALRASAPGSVSGSVAVMAAPSVPTDRAKDGAGSGVLLEGGLIAGAVTFAAYLIPQTRPYVVRAFNVVLGLFGLGLKKAERPEIIAQRMVDELETQGPVFTRNIQEAATIVQKLRIQVRDADADIAKKQASIDALVTTGKTEFAVGLEAQNELLRQQNVANREQLALAEQGLEKTKQDQVRFFQDRQEMLGKVEGQLARSRRVELQKKMADIRLKHYDIGGLDSQYKRLQDAVNEQEAGAVGAQVAVEANPEEQVRQAMRDTGNDEARKRLEARQAELAKRQGGAPSVPGDSAKDGAGSGVVMETSSKIETFLKSYAFRLGVLGAVTLGILIATFGARPLEVMAAIGAINGLFLPYLRASGDNDPKVVQSLLNAVSYVMAAGIGAVIAFGAAQWFSMALLGPWMGAATGLSTMYLMPKFTAPAIGLPVLTMMRFGLRGAATAAVLPIALFAKLGSSIDARSKEAAKTPTPSVPGASGKDASSAGRSSEKGILLPELVVTPLAAAAILAVAWTIELTMWHFVIAGALVGALVLAFVALPDNGDAGGFTGFVIGAVLGGLVGAVIWAIVQFLSSHVHVSF